MVDSASPPDAMSRLLQRLRAAAASPDRLAVLGRDDDDPQVAEALRLIAQLGPTDEHNLLQTIVDHIPDMIFVKHADDLRFVQLNPAGERIFGRKAEDIVGRTDYDFFPADEADFFTSKDREVLADGQLRDIPEESIHSPTGVRYLHTKKIPVAGPDGRPRYLLGISEDVTARKLAREDAVAADAARRRAQEELEVLLDHFPGAVWTTDDELRIVSVAGEQTGSIALDESAVGQPMADHIPASAAAIGALHAVSDLGGATYDFHADGRTYQVSVSQLSERGPARLLWIALDVTQRRRLDGEVLRARLERSQRLEQLGLLVGGIAHDFNNLLTAVQGNVALARQRLPQGAAGSEQLEEALRETEIAAELTQQLLAYAGRGRLRTEPLDLSELVGQLGKLMRSSVSKKALLAFDLADDLPPISADAAQVRQVVLNLVTNASDALVGNEGRIVVRTYSVTADRAMLASAFVDDDLPEGTYVVVEVRDSGHGMDAETQTRAFDPFFSTKERGQGLGLAATLGIVRQHRGTITVSTRPKKGSSFRVLLPASVGLAEADRDAPRLAEAAPRILVVDDEPAVRAVARTALLDEGYEVIEAADGRQALERLAAAEAPLDVVLLDLTMPALSGTETLREIKQLFPDTQVILSSGYAEPEALSRAGGGQAAAFLPKPYTPDMLTALVRDVMLRRPMSRSG